MRIIIKRDLIKKGTPKIKPILKAKKICTWWGEADLEIWLWLSDLGNGEQRQAGKRLQTEHNTRGSFFIRQRLCHPAYYG